MSGHRATNSRYLSGPGEKIVRARGQIVRACIILIQNWSAVLQDSSPPFYQCPIISYCGKAREMSWWITTHVLLLDIFTRGGGASEVSEHQAQFLFLLSSILTFLYYSSILLPLRQTEPERERQRYTETHTFPILLLPGVGAFYGHIPINNFWNSPILVFRSDYKAPAHKVDLWKHVSREHRTSRSATHMHHKRGLRRVKRNYFNETLHQLVDNCKQRCVIVGGDLNARLQYRLPLEQQWIGPYIFTNASGTNTRPPAIDTQMNRLLFMDLCASHNLLAMNSWFKHALSRKVTRREIGADWKDTVTERSHAELDYTLTPKRWRNSVLNVFAYDKNT